MNGFCLVFTCFIVVLSNSSGLHAKVFNLTEAIAKYKKCGCKQPKPESDGRTQSLNRKGGVSPALDENSRKFIEYAKDKTVLEVGGAYGKVMVHTLSKYSSTTYHLSDIDKHHVFIAANNLQKAGISNKALQKARFFELDITKPINNIKQKYDAILVSRVLHFFSPKQLEIAIINIHKLLNNGGRVYILAITPYVKRFKKFIPVYEKRMKNSATYPGYVNSLYDWVNVDSVNSTQLKNLHNKPFMFMDKIVLSKLFKKYNFKVLECKNTPLQYSSASWSLDGRENVILIAQKK